VIHFLFSLTHLEAGSLVVVTLPAWNNLLCDCMVLDLKTISAAPGMESVQTDHFMPACINGEVLLMYS